MTEEYFNVDNIMISNDEMIGKLFKKTTINSALAKTPYMLNISEKIGNLSLDYFYKISIEIATLSMLEQDDGLVNQELKRSALLVYGVMCGYIEKAGHLTEEEMSEDIIDIQNINDYQFYERLNQILIEYSDKFQNLNEQFYHA
jgi:hypothetical protein